MYVKDGGRVKYGVGKYLVLACVMNVVPPYSDVHADGGGKVGGVTVGDRGV